MVTPMTRPSNLHVREELLEFMEEQHTILSVIISAQKSESALINLDLTGIISL